jgi:hypothetical protein
MRFVFEYFGYDGAGVFHEVCVFRVVAVVRGLFVLLALLEIGIDDVLHVVVLLGAVEIYFRIFLPLSRLVLPSSFMLEN